MNWSTSLQNDSGYWSETRRPLVNLAFVAPWLLAYEAGIWCLGAGDGLRNGADGWLRDGLTSLGGTQWWLLPAALMTVLLVWQLAAGESWRLRVDTLGGMLAECLLFACLLILFGQMLERSQRLMLDVGPGPWPGAAVRAVSFLGAGLYEEFLFRLCLIPLLLWICSAVLPRRWALGVTLVATSLAFSMAHYLGPAPDGQVLSVLTDAMVRVQTHRELWFGFAFRALAGLAFGALFCARGFGIAMGTHALYDLVVGIVLVTEL